MAGQGGPERIGVAIVWFILLGLGLSPVMVGATEVIVGNAPVELAGVASGLQFTAMQLGGTLGTAVLGAVMSAKIGSCCRPAGTRRTCPRSPRPSSTRSRARPRWAWRR